MNTAYSFIKLIDYFLSFSWLNYLLLLYIFCIAILQTQFFLLLLSLFALAIIYLFRLVWFFLLVMLLLYIFKVLWPCKTDIFLFLLFYCWLFGCFWFLYCLFGEETEFILLLSIKIDQFILFRSQFRLLSLKWLFDNQRTPCIILYFWLTLLFLYLLKLWLLPSFKFIIFVVRIAWSGGFGICTFFIDRLGLLSLWETALLILRICWTMVSIPFIICFICWRSCHFRISLFVGCLRSFLLSFLVIFFIISGLFRNDLFTQTLFSGIFASDSIVFWIALWITLIFNNIFFFLRNILLIIFVFTRYILLILIFLWMDCRKIPLWHFKSLNLIIFSNILHFAFWIYFCLLLSLNFIFRC